MSSSPEAVYFSVLLQPNLSAAPLGGNVKVVWLQRSAWYAFFASAARVLRKPQECKPSWRQATPAPTPVLTPSPAPPRLNSVFSQGRTDAHRLCSHRLPRAEKLKRQSSAHTVVQVTQQKPPRGSDRRSPGAGGLTLWCPRASVLKRLDSAANIAWFKVREAVWLHSQAVISINEAPVLKMQLSNQGPGPLAPWQILPDGQQAVASNINA